MQIIPMHLEKSYKVNKVTRMIIIIIYLILLSS